MAVHILTMALFGRSDTISPSVVGDGDRALLVVERTEAVVVATLAVLGSVAMVCGWPNAEAAAEAVVTAGVCGAGLDACGCG